MLKHRVSLKCHPNRSFLSKVTNKTSLRTFSKMKISQIWIENYSIMECFSINFFYLKNEFFRFENIGYHVRFAKI